MPQVPVEVRVAIDPQGRPAVLLQLPDGYVLMQPEGAVELARMIVEVAAQIPQATGADSWGGKVCRCDCAYVGAHLAGTPDICEQCRGLIDDVAQKRMDEVYAQQRAELEQWAKDNGLEPS